MRFLEFFATNIRNPHMRRAYARAAEEFLAWCAIAGVPSIAAVQPVHVATWIEADTRKLAAPSVKQRLAAIRHLFGQVVVKPAGSLGPRHVVASGRTPVLDPSEARGLLDSIDSSTHAGLRDRALIALMVYSLARIGAAVEDVYTQNPPTVGAAAREGRQAACEPSQPQGIPHRPSRRGGTPRRSQGTALPARSCAAPASSPARCCRERTPR